MFFKFFFFSFLLFLISFFSSCTAVVAGNTVANFATEDRPFGDSVKDSETEIYLKNAFFQKNHAYLTEVSIFVSERRALLTGSVETESEIQDIIEITRSNSYITDIYNHISLKDKDSVRSDGIDIFLNKKIFAELLGGEHITSANYKTVVQDRIAYIIGSTKSLEEKKLVLERLRNISGLRKIVDYIIIIEE